jgi:hypothetical protein
MRHVQVPPTVREAAPERAHRASEECAAKEEIAMSSTPSDVMALAREAATYYTAVDDFVQEDVLTGLQESRGNLAGAAKYPLLRLRGLRAITDRDKEDLRRLVEAVGAGAETAALVAAIQERNDASPVAVALAGLAQVAVRTPQWQASVLVGAVVGAYLSFAVGESGVPSSSAATDGIRAAIGGALAGRGLEIAHAVARQFEAQQPSSAADHPAP